MIDERTEPPSGKSQKNSRLWTVLRWAVSATVLGVILSRMHVSSLPGIIRSADVGLVALVLCLSVVNQLCSAAKLTLILSPLAMTFAHVVRFTFIATFFNAVLPSGGGEVVRMLYINKKAASGMVSASAVIIDRLTSLFTQILIVTSSVAFFSGDFFNGPTKSIAAIILTALVAVLVLLLVCPAGAFSAIEKHLPWQHFWKGKTGLFFLSILSRRLALTSIIILSVLYNCIVIGMVLLLTTAFSSHLRFFEAAIVVFCGSLGTVLPISIGGLGIVEGIYAAMFKVLDNHKETGLAVSLGLRCALLLPVLVGFFLFVHRGKETRLSESVGS
jgi:glycosyltransferase 2 family protein